MGKRVRTHSAPTFKGRCSINLGQRRRRDYLVLFLSSRDIVVPPVDKNLHLMEFIFYWGADRRCENCKLV